MSNAYYKLYLDSVMSLAKTMIIKSESTAEAINTGLSELGVVVDELNPHAWKYYLNLSGQYHHTDSLMRVTSLDTLEEIPFDIATLDLHRSTFRGYSYGSRFYKELVQKYPTQEQLILGILNPVNIDVAIDALDGKILYVDPGLIENNETTLVHKLQERIDGFMLRWNVADYAKVDDLYAACHLAILYMNIPLFVLQARLENCRTEQVHSFHIRQYLASNGRLDSYLTHLNKKQMLFLYRNIRYIHRNAGKQETFDWLVDKVLTGRLLPLAKYDLVHNVENQPNDLYPVIEAKRIDLTKYVSGNPKDIYSVRELITKEQNQAPGNLDAADDAVAYTTEVMQTSIHNQLGTKVLESSVVDRSSAYTMKLADVLLNHWVYLAHRNLYPTIITIDNPRTGEPLWINTKDAFILFLYAYNKSIGITLETVPSFKANFVRKLTPPTFAALRAISEPRYVPDYYIRYVRDTVKPIGGVISTDGFYNLCKEIHEQWRLHHNFIGLREHHIERGQVEAITYHNYQDYECNLADEAVYDDWLSDHSLDLSELTRSEFELLWATLLAKSTGANLHVTYSVTELQQSMLRLMRQLSSYTVQFIDEARGSNMWVLDWSTLRVGDQTGSGQGNFKLHQNTVYVQDANFKGLDYLYVDLSDVTYNMGARTKEKDSSWLEMAADFDDSVQARSKIRVVMPSVYATLKEVRTLELSEVLAITTVPDYEYPASPPEDLTH